MCSYVAPEYASTGMLNESSDIYSFGVLLMELISGRSPVDYNRPAGEVNLVEWFRGMVGSRRVEDLADPRIVPAPAPRVLNRVLLVCLRCIDSDAHKRPKMGQIDLECPRRKTTALRAFGGVRRHVARRG